MARRLTLAVTPGMDGRTVDSLLRKELGLSGTLVKRAKWLEDGILLDGKPVAVNVKAAAGQELSVVVEDAGNGVVVPSEGPVDVVYEDEDIFVVTKAPGVSVHPGPGHWDDTLGNFILGRYRAQGSDAGFHPVHRLDKGTSGLIVIAKHPHAQEKLKQQLHTGAFRRVYLAVCDGIPQPSQGVVDAPIGRADGSILRREVRPDGLEARTRYETLETANGRALLRLTLDTGRTHQIRVHMTHLGYPLTGDFLYGTENQELISRPALHSAELEIKHPVTGEGIRLRCELPEDMRKLIINI